MSIIFTCCIQKCHFPKNRIYIGLVYLVYFFEINAETWGKPIGSAVHISYIYDQTRFPFVIPWKSKVHCKLEKL